MPGAGWLKSKLTVLTAAQTAFAGRGVDWNEIDAAEFPVFGVTPAVRTRGQLALVERLSRRREQLELRRLAALEAELVALEALSIEPSQTDIGAQFEQLSATLRKATGEICVWSRVQPRPAPAWVGLASALRRTVGTVSTS